MSIKVTLPTHVVFDDGTKKIECQLQDGSRGWQEGSSQPSTLNITGGGKRYGDYEPHFSHLEQRTFHGGRGVENYVDDQTGYFDGQALWSLTPNHLFPAPLWKFAKGLKTTDESLGVDRTWKKLIDESRYVSVSVGAISSADYGNIWLRRRGEPGTLTLELRADSGGDPTGTLHKTVTKTVSDITDTISVFEEFDWSSTQTLSSGDHIKIYGPSDSTVDNCWEVAVDTSGSSSKISSDASTWNSASYTLLYRLSTVDIKRKFLDFALEGAMYIVSINDDESNSKLFINGGRGTASSASSTTLVDSGIGWTASRFINAWVKIIAGTGQGQTRKITANTTDTLTVATWDKTPSSSSRYVIYGTPWFLELTSTGLGVVKDVAVINNIVYFAQGSGDNIRRMYDNAGAATYADDGTNKADLFHPFHDAADGPQMWRAINGTTMEVSRATKAAWGTNLEFNAGIPVGSTDYLITNITDYNNQLWVTKRDSIWSIQNDVATKLPAGLSGLPSKYTGYAIAVQNLFLYFGWWKSFERLFGSTLDDEGIWKKGSGLPLGRSGYVSGLVPLLPWLFQSLDAGTGTSSVYIYLASTFHEMFRGFKAGHRIRNIFAQENDDINPWLWIDYNGELIYQEYSLTPLTETFEVQHEAVMISSTHDMGHAETFKFFKDLSALVDNLNNEGIYIGVDYQWGKYVNTSTWIPATSLYVSPTDVTDLNIGETSVLRYRLRINTDDASVIPDVKAVVVKGFEVVPVKKLWTMRIQASSLLSRGRSTSPDELYDWLWEASQKAKLIKMYTSFPGVTNIQVKLEPPNTFWKFVNKASKWTGVFTITVREM